MISTDQKFYNYFLYTDDDGYGQPQLTEEPVGQIQMSIYITQQSIQDNINYSNCNYIGLTRSLLDDSYVIQYGDEKLKVLYVNPQGRMKQVFLVKI